MQRNNEVPCESRCTRHEDDEHCLHHQLAPGYGHLAHLDGLQHLLLKAGSLHDKLREFVILMYLFCNNHRTYKTVRNEAHVRIDGYKDVYLSFATINKWFGYFRRLCVEDNKKYPVKIGGCGDIVEIDESMCGKLKYGKGDGRKRRRQWIFGGVSRTSGRFFMTPCPDNKRTRKSLWPIIQANIVEGTTIHSDGWRCYRRLSELNYNHRWINHELHYVDPTDPTLHTNGIEGLCQVKVPHPQITISLHVALYMDCVHHL